jgi:type II secretory pathway pseudopilin PulG
VKSRTIRTSVRNRSGLTLIELLVVLIIAFVAMALFLPGILQTRGRSRRVQCLNNVHNITLAITNFASGRSGGLPYLDEGEYNWPVSLLSYLDRSDLVDAPAYYNTLSLDVLTCADDANNFRTLNGLSYGLNGGYGDFPRSNALVGIPPVGSAGTNSQVTEMAATLGNYGCHAGYDFGWISGKDYPRTCPPPAGTGTTDSKDADCARDTGVFWHDLRGYGNCPYFDDPFRMTLDRISSGDGLSQTFMLLENHNARNWGAGVAGNTAYGALGASPIFSAVLDCAVVIHRGDLQLGSSAGPLAITGHVANPISRINSNRGLRPGRSPFASSSHPGLVVVGFCDGRARVLNESISFEVYASLFTSGGAGRGEAAISDTAY